MFHAVFWRVRLLIWLFLLGYFVAMPRAAWGTVLASDNASDLAYTAEIEGAWKGLNPSTDENPPGTDNGGFGFSPWNFAGGNHAQQHSPYDRLNHFIDSVDFAGSAFNNLGAPAFGLTNANLAFEGYTSRATRVFNSALAIGDTLSIDFDNPVPAPLDVDDSSGFLFRLNTGGGPRIASYPGVAERFGMLVTSGFNNNNWTTTDLTGFVDTGVGALSTSVATQFRFTLMATNSYSISLVRLSDGHVFSTRAGLLSATNAGPIDTLEILLFGNGSGNGLAGSNGLPTGERELFFNNLRIEREDNAALLAGDYNENGIVDAADYVIWRRALNTIYTQEHHDIWRAHLGQTVPPAGTGSSMTRGIPEPKTITLLLACGIVLILASCRSGRF